MGLTGFGKFGKGFLIAINILFFILGLGLFVLGILMKVNVSAINNDVKPALNGVTVASYKLGNLVDSLAILFIVIGAFILIVSGLGLFGACCKVKCMLVTYAVLVMILFVMKISGIALWFTMRSGFEDVVKEGMLKSLKDNYKTDTIDSSNSVSNAWNYMFMSLQCCGVVDMKTDLGTGTPAWITGGLPSTTQIPRTCCIGADSSNYKTNPKLVTCQPGTADYNMKGCYAALKDEITTYGNIFVGVGITILLIELLAVVFAFVICCQTGDKNHAV